MIDPRQWLYFLFQEKFQGQRPPDVPMTPHELAQGLSDLFPDIMENRDAWVHDLRQPSDDPMQLSDSDDLFASVSEITRRNVICDILSTFEAETLPEDMVVYFSKHRQVPLQLCLGESLRDTLFSMVSATLSHQNQPWRDEVYYQKG